MTAPDHIYRAVRRNACIKGRRPQRHHAERPGGPGHRRPGTRVARPHRHFGRTRLFHSVGKSGRLGERLDPSQVPRIFKAMAQQAGLPPAAAQGLSWHSARVGAAQDMIAAGIQLPAILQAER